MKHRNQGNQQNDMANKRSQDDMRTSGQESRGTQSDDDEMSEDKNR